MKATTTIRNTSTIARWEVRRLIWNKTFIISLILTPILIGVFAGLPALLAAVEDVTEERETFTLYVLDELGIYESLYAKMERAYTQYATKYNIILQRFAGSREELEARIGGNYSAGYMVFNNETIRSKEINIVLGGTYGPDLDFIKDFVQPLLLHHQLAQYNIDPDEIDRILAGYSIRITPMIVDEIPEDIVKPGIIGMIAKWIPGIFAGLILFLAFISGMTTMQSAISDKKDKIVEILLSSVSADELMQGKIIGNFIAGLIQGSVYLIYILIALSIFGGIPLLPIILDHLLVPVLPEMLFFTLTGYLLFSALFIGLGATMEDVSTAGNFQSLIMMLPMLPVVFVFPIVKNPDGLVALVASYIPFVTPLAMLIRMTLTDMSALEIILPAIVLVVSTLIVSKIAGRIFRVGILMYGKNASPLEIWKWIRQ
ncbi:MAG: ABC transporter permease [Methanophagales archaeon]|nr:ABC transporter permease [Methanophagales archaeon]